MKVPFNYRAHFFHPILFASFAGHLACFALPTFFFSPSQYAVQTAPSSMEVTILEHREVRRNVQKTLSVLTAEEAEVKIKKEHEEKKLALEKTVRPFHVPAAKGAKTEAKPLYLRNPAPIYPEYARVQGWEGTVTLRVRIDTQGRPGEIRIDQSTGYKILDEAAVKAVKKWKFKPAQFGAVPFASQVKIPVRFMLTDF